jgi:hypothetical protein
MKMIRLFIILSATSGLPASEKYEGECRDFDGDPKISFTLETLSEKLDLGDFKKIKNKHQYVEVNSFKLLELSSIFDVDTHIEGNFAQSPASTVLSKKAKSKNLDVSYVLPMINDSALLLELHGIYATHAYGAEDEFTPNQVHLVKGSPIHADISFQVRHDTWEKQPLICKLNYSQS